MQQVAPPLTGIHTPIKGGNSIFAFHRNNIQDNSVLPVLPVKRKSSGMLTITSYLLAIFLLKSGIFHMKSFKIVHMCRALLLILDFFLFAK